MNTPKRYRPALLTRVILLVALCVGLLDCASVRGRRGEPERSGFLGDYSQLKEQEGYDARLIYVAQGVDWDAYEAVHIDSVTLWANEDTARISDEDRQMLTDVMFKALRTELGAQFQLVDQPGPGVLRVRAALTQAKGAKVALRTITSILPPAWVVSTAGGLATDTASLVGTATLEIEVVDSITSDRLAAAVDSRAGTKSILAGKRTFTKWGDVEAADRFWANRVTGFFVRQGVQRKPGAPEFEEGK